MMRTVAIWAVLAALIAVPIIASGFSPLLAWRQPVYIMAGFAGVIGLALMLVQPLAAAGYLPGLSPFAARRVHRVIGIALLSCVALHVAGLWITSPPDMIDALLLRAPTVFSFMGVAAMWAILAAGVLALLRGTLGLKWRVWRALHATLAGAAVAGTVPHALLIDGTMETVSKVVLCAAVGLVTLKVLYDLRLWSSRPQQPPKP